MDFVAKESYAIKDLVEIVRLLRSPQGCPWDREQTHTSIRKNLLEEAYEVAEGIDLDDKSLLCEELGDLLLQILLHSEIEREEGVFDFDDVCDSISKKLIHRHPHVFESHETLSSEEVLANWETIKNSEKKRETAKDRIDSVPASLPALMRSSKLQKRALDFGFRYKDVYGALEDLESEILELKAALNGDGNTSREMGDVLFSAVNVARELNLDAEEELSKSADCFAQRVKTVERLALQDGQDPQNLSLDCLDRYWRLAKQDEDRIG